MTVNNGELVPYWRSFVKASELVGAGRAQLTKRAAETADEIERLRAKLLKHGRHTRECAEHHGHDCNCGWEELKREVSQ